MITSNLTPHQQLQPYHLIKIFFFNCFVETSKMYTKKCDCARYTAQSGTVLNACYKYSDCTLLMADNVPGFMLIS